MYKVTKKVDRFEVELANNGFVMAYSGLNDKDSGERNRRSTMQFKVRWLGYGPEHDSWEPYKYLRDTQQLHDYLRANRMTSLIPAKFR